MFKTMIFVQFCNFIFFPFSKKLAIFQKSHGKLMFE